ncbi:CBS domain-containing protein [Streptomyces sp. NPDC088124]|uniref:CBS domain-containing protein n=1 Tax=unclassified Streptomyces TaxID=2593676 RepID=UPI002E7A7F09|nr:CBS domain-containing protein [Streptomyces sp. JV176]MEE1804613.1 CBS domain-containing protein [Streptomyces sp. JV176]
MTTLPSEEEILALKGRKIPVAEFLTVFRTRVRDHSSNQVINQRLDEVGLATVPHFANCGRNADVHIVAQESVPDPDPENSSGEEDDDGLSTGSLPQHAVRIGDIPAATQGIASVTSRHLLADAIHLMQTMNYSQIPVLDDPYTLPGVVTWQSATQMYGTSVDRVLLNAMVNDPPVAEAHQDFFSLLPMISKHGYLVIRGGNGRFTGIVTTADITEQFASTAWPFFVVGEIEFRLRKCLGAKIGSEAVLAVQKTRSGKKTGLITDLTFGDYVKLLNGDQQDAALCALADENWRCLGWSWVSRSQFVRQLGSVQQSRNKIAHFDPEPLSPSLSDDLRQFVGLLRQLS